MRRALFCGKGMGSILFLFFSVGVPKFCPHVVLLCIVKRNKINSSR